MAQGPTGVLSRFVVDTGYADLPAEVVDQVKRAILDTLGCGIAGCTMEEKALNPVLQVVKAMGGQAGSDGHR